MRRRKSEGVNRIAALDQPGITAAEALRRNLLLAAYEEATPEDMRRLVRKQIDKGLEGDTKAFREVMAIVKAGETPSEPATVNVQNNITNQAVFIGTDGIRVSEQDLIRNAVFIIGETGPKTLDALAQSLHLLQTQIADALSRKPEWFEKAGGRYSLTNQAHREVLEPLKG